MFTTDLTFQERFHSINMLKSILLVSGLTVLSLTLQAQNLVSKTSEVNFFSKTPLENIEAKNTKARAIINPANMDIAIKMTNTEFDFPNNLMEEHFNEKYMESEKYPTSFFQGRLDKQIDLTKPGKHEVAAVGKLTMHGVTKDKTIKGTINVTENGFTMSGEFDVMLVDYNIERPSIVMAKIADKIDVNAVFTFVAKK
jgi:polyisoprenoid-binding protein YceI